MLQPNLLPVSPCAEHALLHCVAQAAQDALLKRAKANSLAQLGKYDPASEDESAGDRTYEKNYVY